MRRLVSVFAMIYLAVALLVVFGDAASPEAVACGAPLPTSTAGPPTATGVPPTASPPIVPTVGLETIPMAKAPPGLDAIAACQTREQVRAMLRLFLDLFEGWDLVPIGKGPPPQLILVVFEHAEDSRQTIALSTSGDDPPTEPDSSAAQRIAREYQEELDAGASIATDRKLVWMRYQEDGRHHLTWGPVDGNRVYTVIADYAADVNRMIDTLARAAEHACYPDCQ